MAKKGARKSQKRVSAGKAAKLNRKYRTFTFRKLPGSHTKETSASLGVVLREMLQIGQTANDIQFVLDNKKVKVDGRIAASPKRGIGLFDVLSVGEKNYRIVLDKKGRLAPAEITAKETVFKLCKVLGKKAVGKKGFQYRLNDGRSIVDKSNAIKPGDTIKISVPKQSVLEHFILEKGNTALVVSGKRVSSLGKISKILPGTISRDRLVRLSIKEERDFETVSKNVFVVGKQGTMIGVTSE